MFWIVAIILVAAFVAIVTWLGRARGSAKGMPAADLDHNVRRTHTKSQGQVGNYDNL